MRFSSQSVVLTNIQWDTEGQTKEECNLPETVLVVDLNELIDSNVRDFIGTELVNAFGFNHSGYDLDRFVNQETHQGGGFFPKNLAVIQFDSFRYRKSL